MLCGRHVVTAGTFFFFMSYGRIIDRIFNVIYTSFAVFFAFAVIPVLYRTVIACYTAVNLCGTAAFRAGKMLAGYIAVLTAYGICR